MVLKGGDSAPYVTLSRVLAPALQASCLLGFAWRGCARSLPAFAVAGSMGRAPLTLAPDGRIQYLAIFLFPTYLK